MASNDYETMPIDELEDLAYALQLSYDPPLTEDQRGPIIDQILWIKEHANLLNEAEIRQKWEHKRREAKRRMSWSIYIFNS